ncbi:MAG: acyl-CoA dehydrogenase C-terminal domain-containing protein [Alphaproteobacteria bacterium]|nr:acyl-CoA dehydrogenase C-terminal domain-containing protein [Alphaproteobacteria bacterium]
MTVYHAPIRDMSFVLYELIGAERMEKLPGNEETTRDLVEAILEEAAKFCGEVLLPINASGDHEGCKLENGVVRTPKGFKEAYDQFAEGGWTALGGNPEFGGQGLPHMVSTLVEEMICSTNLSFGMYPGLTHGAVRAIEAFGSDAQKRTYLPNMISGVWSGTMNLTEPQCGTDLGLIRTKAVPQDDGSYKISGTKIYISAGEHDLTDNIIHLVLARTPDAPAGIKGISLFIVPKFLVNEDGGLGNRNGVQVGSIEDKMGIKASSTCVMNYEEAEGYLIGDLHRGMRAMFMMMNAARFGVGMQGLGIAEASYQNAVAFTKDRLQGRSLSGAKYPDKPADPIIVHPDVRRTLMTMRAYTEGMRALSAWVAEGLDIAEKSPDPAERQEADDLVALLTPIVKAFMTDQGFELANHCVQLHGGHGFIKDYGVEQYVRDSRITLLYEGTNGIQALDLVGRKMGQNMGRLLRRFFHPVSQFIEENQEDMALAPYVMPLAKAFGRLQRATAHLAQQGLKDPEEAAAAATEYLRLFSLVTLAFMWAKTAKIALEKQDGDDTGFYKGKLTTATFYMERILPQASALFAQIMAGKETMMSFAEDEF